MCGGRRQRKFVKKFNQVNFLLSRNNIPGGEGRGQRTERLKEQSRGIVNYRDCGEIEFA